MYSTACLNTAKNCLNGFKKERLFTFAEMKSNMANDVHNALLEIIEKEGGMSREEAEAYLADMQQQKRYQRDVY